MVLDFDSEVIVDNVTYQAKPLHTVPKFIEECCHLINLEWPRSYTARLRSIESSCNNFPTNLILLIRGETDHVIGHCKISKISPKVPAVFVESVVIHPDFRGKGLGKLLMLKTESYVLSKRIEWVYLSTQGQEIFYEKLGYSKCKPINIYGCPLSFDPDNENEDEEICKKFEKCDIDFNLKSCQKLDVPSPPPPPPFPPSQLSTKSTTTTNSKKTFMRKKLIIQKI